MVMTDRVRAVLARVGAIAGLLLLVALIGAVDVWSGHYYGMSLFYLVPVTVAAWRLGRQEGMLLAASAAAVWTVADLVTVGGAEVAPLTASLWNGFTRLVIFNGIAFLLDRLRKERDHHIEVNVMREQLLYSVAHELRGPLAVLQNALDILGEGYADLSTDEFARLTDSARRTAGRLRTLMDDLLSAGAIQAGGFRIDPCPIELHEIVTEAIEMLAPLIDERGQTVEIGVPNDLTVLADHRYARQVLTNLLSNASRYGPQGSTLRIAAEPLDGQVRVAVADHGVGIPKDLQTHLFERYYRTRAGGPGIGLGLAISKGIVEAHGGRIGLESEPGQGTTVWFTLPQAAA